MSICPKCSKPASGDRKICRACGGILEHAPGDPLLDHDADLSPPDSPPPKPHTPLGLPHGSIRSLITLLIVAVVVEQIVRERELELLWTETLMIALAHYFTSRRFIHLSPELIGRLQEEGHIQTEARPLYLPRHSIRAILILSFVGLGVYLFQKDQILQPQALSVLGVVFAYFLGLLARFKDVPGWEDLKAGIVLSLLGFVAGAYFLDRADMVPPLMRNATLALVLSYFGSR